MTTTCDAGNTCIGLRQVQNVAGFNHNEKTLIQIYQSSTSCRWSVFGISKTRMLYFASVNLYNVSKAKDWYLHFLRATSIWYSNMTSFKRFESKPVVKIILIYDRLNLWRHRQFITIFYQFLHIRIEIIHGSHMYILFLPRVGLYVSFFLTFVTKAYLW